MPVRIGFIQYRLQLLRQELERLVAELPALGALKVIITGDLLTEDIKPSSIIELIIVAIGASIMPVSYTHLTLPTILLV